MVTLHHLTKADLPFLLEVRNDESTRMFLENDSIFTLEECEKWFSRQIHPWFIIKNQADELVGYFRTGHFDEVGCDIHPAHRRKGYAKAAYLEYLKDKTHATLWVFVDNFAKQLYESIGFTSDGIVRVIRAKHYLHMQWKNQ